MEIMKRVVINITFVDKEAEMVKAFKDKHPDISHREVYLKGLAQLPLTTASK